MARLVEAVLQSKDHVIPAMMDFLDNLLDEKNELTELVEAPGTVIDILKKTKVNILICLYYSLDQSNVLSGCRTSS